MTVAESLKRFRKMFNLKQKDIAAVLEVTPQAYQVYESKVTPSVNLIITLANHYKVSADYLLGLSDNPRPVQIENPAPADIDDNKDLITAAENDRVLDFYENLAHKLAEQGIKI